ncbi:hypothetical protein ICS_05670 [Bacillus cereus BAG2O-3]|nr:hypothetical protein ICS_05670 [Bacillus cereus BAG2O-3]MDA1602054.1 hypothetical protein [Bacillus cereus]SCV19904.1 Uncharacterized protein BCRIVMBC845_02399 [Bacillus cereus]
MVDTGYGQGQGQVLMTLLHLALPMRGHPCPSTEGFLLPPSTKKRYSFLHNINEKG